MFTLPHFPRFGSAIRELPLAEIKTMVLNKNYNNSVLYYKKRLLRSQQLFLDYFYLATECENLLIFVSSLVFIIFEFLLCSIVFLFWLK